MLWPTTDENTPSACIRLSHLFPWRKQGTRRVAIFLPTRMGTRLLTSTGEACTRCLCTFHCKGAVLPVGLRAVIQTSVKVDRCSSCLRKQQPTMGARCRYLNDCEVGGATRIFSKSEDSPSAGFVTDDGGRFRYDESKFVDKAKVRDGTGTSMRRNTVC